MFLSHSGVIQYRLFLSFAKMLLVSYYMNSRISVMNLTTHPESNSIHARWSFTGLPMHRLFFIFKSDKSELYRWENMSIYETETLNLCPN